MGKLSFSHVKWTGMSPDVTLQLTWARFPSCKFAEKENGSISGGSEKIIFLKTKRNSEFSGIT